ncbi:hypothetical protein BK127_37060 [Paenibacillus sp. FSL H7-0331]|jgi:hypothetical protein|nr:hypothetical protein BK127_37060 [Paenibacillus sp. FSL H7-0331]
MYLGRPSVFLLQAYMNGYVDYYNEVNEEQNYFFLPQFQEYIQKRFKIESTHSWAQIISFYSSSDEEAFNAFYRLLDEFIEEAVEITRTNDSLKHIHGGNDIT